MHQLFCVGVIYCFVILHINPAWCTIFLRVFISFLYMFRATMCPSSGEISVCMRHLVLVTLKQLDSFRVTSTKCRVNTVISPDDGHIVDRNALRKEINILR